MKRSGNHDRINKLLFPDRLNLLKNLIIKGAQALCRPWERGRTLVRVMEERACCRKAAKEGKKLLKEKSSNEKAWDILMRYGSCVFKLLIDCQLRVSVDA